MSEPMDRDRAFNIIAGIVMANKDFDNAEKTQLLKWLRHVEEIAAEREE